MKLRYFGALAGLVLVSLSGAVAAKTNSHACGCASGVHHTAMHRTEHHAVDRHVRGRAVARNAPHYAFARHAAHAVPAAHHAMGQQSWARDMDQSDSARYARSYYDYRSSSTVTESIDRRAMSTTRQPWRAAQDDARIRFHYYGQNARTFEQRGGGQTTIHGQDFEGGVGYGVDGSFYGGYQGGTGQMYSRSGGMNGAAISNYGYDGNAAGMAHARMDAWHGYNSHNGISNGY